VSRVITGKKREIYGGVVIRSMWYKICDSFKVVTFVGHLACAEVGLLK